MPPSRPPEIEFDPRECTRIEGGTYPIGNEPLSRQFPLRTRCKQLFRPHERVHNGTLRQTTISLAIDVFCETLGSFSGEVAKPNCPYQVPWSNNSFPTARQFVPSSPPRAPGCLGHDTSTQKACPKHKNRSCLTQFAPCLAVLLFEREHCDHREGRVSAS